MINSKFNIFINKKTIPINDRAFNYGDGLFETILVKNNKIIYLNEHVKRLHEGCDIIFINKPALSLIKKNAEIAIGNTKNCVLKIILSRGSCDFGYQYPKNLIPNLYFIKINLSSEKTNETERVNITYANYKPSENNNLSKIKHLNRLDQCLVANELQNIENNYSDLAVIQNNNIIEIGPGTGNLTKRIINQNPKSLILIEKDQNLIDHLKNEFRNKKNIKFFNEDILKFQLESKMSKNSIIVGNLPYNISSQILVKLIKFNEWLPKYKKLILMFQKEVADKILAKNQSPSFGRLAVLTKARLQVTNYFNVSKNCFYPVPKVESTVLVFEPIINQNFKVKNISNLEKVTHVFFSKKRKMINKAFKTLFKKPNLVAEKIKIDLNLRPSKISEKKYYEITEYFEKEI